MKKLLQICRNGEVAQVGATSLSELQTMFRTLIDNLPNASDEEKATLKTQMGL